MNISSWGKIFKDLQVHIHIHGPNSEATQSSLTKKPELESDHNLKYIRPLL